MGFLEFNLSEFGKRPLTPISAALKLRMYMQSQPCHTTFFLATYMSPLLNPLQHCTSLSFSAILPASLHTVGNGSVRLRVLFSLACSGRKGSLWCPWVSSFVIKLVSMSHGLSVVFSFLLFLAVVEERRFSCSWDLGLKKFSTE